LVDLLIKYQTNYNANFKFSIIAKKETAKVGLIKNILSLLDALYLDREDIRQQFKVFEQQNELIKNKYSILIAPEGTRIHGDELGEFKAGAIKVAYHNMIPIQPIAIYGSDGLMDKNKTHMKKDRIVYVDFLPYKKPFDFHMHNIE
jgi:1-acyl-sn-glycerol-3-phosphate acyltransferase